MTPDRDPNTRTVLSWLREEAHENAERVLLRALDEVDATPQRRSWWPAWRSNRMNVYAKLIAAAAGVLAVAVIGYTTLPGIGIVGPGAAPSPSASLIARGSLDQRDWGPVEFEATRDGDTVTGRMTIGRGEELGQLVVDLQCARTTEDGLVMIGGSITDGTGDRFTMLPVGTPAGLVLKPGSPVLGKVWVGAYAYPGTEATDCVAYLDAQLTWDRATFPDLGWFGSGGAVELGPIGIAGPGSTPRLNPSLVRSSFDHRDWGPVEFEAVRDGASVTGRMTIGQGEEGGHLVVDLQCARTSDDGRIAFGGYITDGSGLRFDYRPAGTLTGVVLKRGIPGRGAEIWVGSSPSYPETETTDCLEYLDAWLRWDPDSMGFG